MRKRLFSFFLALAMLSGVSFAMADAPSPAQTQNAAQKNASGQNVDDFTLPPLNPDFPISVDGAIYHVYKLSSAFEDDNKEQRYYYVPKPEVYLHSLPCYDIKTNRFAIQVSMPAYNHDKIAELISKTKGVKKDQVVPMPPIGYDISVCVGNNRQLLASKRDSFQFSGKVPFSDIITNKEISKALNESVDLARVEVTLLFEHKISYGGSARMQFESAYKKRLEERILGSNSAVYISPKSLNRIDRAVKNDLQMELKNKGIYIEIGSGTENIMDKINAQNPTLFKQQSLGEIGELTAPLVIYDPELGRKEIQPDEHNHLVTEYEKSDEVKKYFKSNWESFHQIHNHSNDENQFKQLIEESVRKGGSGGGGINLFNCVSLGGSGSSSKTSTSKSDTSRYSLSWKDFYNMTAQKSFNENDFYSKSTEHWKGENRDYFISPKNYNVTRVGNEDVNTMTNIYVLKVKIENTAKPLSFEFGIGEVVKNTIQQDLSIPGTYAGERKTIVVKGVPIAFRWCPSGTFTMGSPEESEWDSGFNLYWTWDSKQSKYVRDMRTRVKTNNEYLHSEIVNGHWIMEKEVTVEMFRAFVNNTGYQSKGYKPKGFTDVWNEKESGWKEDDKYSWETPGFYYFQKSKDPNYKTSPYQPVTTISYHDALAFCEWLSKETGLNIDLPTEAQWEYDCRAGTTTTFHFGNEVIDNSKLNCNAIEGFNSKAPIEKRHTLYTGKDLTHHYKQQPIPGCGYAPNAWGIYDMHGNVREWCKDCFVKGGGWQDIAWGCRSAWHSQIDPGTRVDYQGFRVIINVE